MFTLNIYISRRIFAVGCFVLFGAFSVISVEGAPRELQDFVVHAWGLEQGLPQDAVRAIAQTPDGYLWVGTFSGLARFDGRHFEVFATGNTAELPNNLVNALFCDHRGRLWIGFDTGHVVVLEGQSFHQVQMPAEFLRIPIRQFGEDVNGGIWLLNAIWKMVIIDSKNVAQAAPQMAARDFAFHFESSKIDHCLRIVTLFGRCYLATAQGFTPDPDGPPAPTDGRRVIHSDAGGYWSVQDQFLCRWNGGKAVGNAGKVNWEESIFAMTCEWHGLVAAGTFRDGLNLAGGDGTRVHFDVGSGLPSNWIAALFVDRDGILWVGTGDGGLAAIWPNRVSVIEPPGEAARKHVQSVTADSNGGIWVATEGAGAFDFNNGSWGQAPELPDGQLPIYSSLHMASDERLWATTPNNGNLYYLQADNWHPILNGSRAAGARGALLMENGAIWVPDGDGLVRLSGEDFGKVTRVRDCPGVCCLAADGQGGIWYGGYGIGLGHWRDGHLTVLHAKDGLPSENLLSLYQTPDGTLWIGTDGKGLVRMSRGRFAVISKRQGLPSDTICQLIEDDTGRLWMGTYAGICAVAITNLTLCAEGRLDEVSCLVLDRADGMKTAECSAGNQPSVCRTSDGRLWFATRRGVAVVSPTRISLDSNPPLVTIEGLQTDAGAVVLGNSSTAFNLPLGKRRLVISFNAPCMRGADRVHFKHQLEPLDSQWIDDDTRREVTFAALPPGNYRFQVIACNEDGVWNPLGAMITFAVPAFLWERIWFVPLSIAVGITIGAAIVIGYLRQRWRRRLELLEHQRAVDRERSRIAKDLHDDLGGSLTEINMLSESLNSRSQIAGTDRETAMQIGRKSSCVVRALDEIVWAVNPKHDSLASLADYLSGFAQEFLSGTGIRLWLEVQRNLPAIPLTPDCRHDIFLTVKEALNNAARHSQATEVWLSFERSSGRLKIVVADNGRGFIGTKNLVQPGDGLSNMRERMAAQGGVCRLTARPEGGTRVELEVVVK